MRTLTICGLLLSLQLFAGVHMTCEQWALDQSGSHDAMLGVKSTSIMRCKSIKRNKEEFYTVLIVGYGLGINMDFASEFALSCPTVSKRKLHRKGQVSLGSIKASASVVVGADVTIALNYKGGFCFMPGYDFLGLSAAVSIGKMTIYKGDIYENREKLLKHLPDHLQ